MSAGGCLSGRKGRGANPVGVHALRGFESHSSRSGCDVTDKRGVATAPVSVGESEAVAWFHREARREPRRDSLHFAAAGAGEGETPA